MNKLQSSAKTLDSCLSFMHKINLIASALLAVGFCVLWILHLASPGSINQESISVNFSMIKFTVDSDVVHNPNFFIYRLSAISLYFLVYMIIWVMIIQCGRKILAPMIRGQAFHIQMSDQLKKLAFLNIALGIVENIGMYALYGNQIPGIDLDAIFSHSGILVYYTDYPWDLSFMYWSAVLFLLSFVFAHGWELQQLSDETL